MKTKLKLATPEKQDETIVKQLNDLKEKLHNIQQEVNNLTSENSEMDELKQKFQ